MTKDLRRLLLDRNLIPLSKQDLLQQVAARSAALGMPCCLVGGFVRDILLGKPVNDYDYVVEGDAIKVGRILVKEFGGKLTTHPKFKTATWFFSEGGFLDLITARSESYDKPGALPTVKPSEISADLRRRDFTINAMAIRLDGDHFGELFDPLGGQSDLKNGLIRILHRRSFVDDPTRMLRAVRYEKRYGLQIESDTLKSFNAKARTVLSELSGERLRHEFDLIFDEENVLSMLTRAAEFDLLKSVHPALTWDEAIHARLSLYLSSSSSRSNLWAVWLMDRSPVEIKSLGRRLHFTAETLACALAASSIFHELDLFARMKPSQCVERLEGMPVDAVTAVARSVSDAKARDMLETYLSKWRDVKPGITGHDLKARGIPPSPKYRQILQRLRAAWVDGEVVSREQENQFLESLLDEKGATR
jgi:tRNA nucleotidyltransferase (CCA-adding enzyme)